MLWQNFGICIHSAERRLKTACNIGSPIQNIHWQYISYILCKYDEIGLVTPEITRVTNGPFWMRQQKLDNLTEYFTN